MLGCVPGQALASPPVAAVHALLDVPYVAQTPALCGGAAVAMVLRYWGTRDVFPEDFAPLVPRGAGGILTGALAAAVVDRGWQAHILPTTGAAVRTRLRAELDQGRPLIALIEVAPRTYHYVVVVGSTDAHVVVHDPARAPFRTLPWQEFQRAWAAAGRWLMLVLPPARASTDVPATGLPETSLPAPTAAPDTTGPIRPTPCAALVEQSVGQARAGDADSAEHGLVAAALLCPLNAAPPLELAGLRFVQRRWPEAETLALAAVRIAPADTYAWQLLAASRHLMGHPVEALEAWNHLDEPRVDTIAVHGAVRTRQPTVVRTLNLPPRSLLTPDRYGRALRRLRALPIASSARMRVEPLDGGLTRVDAFIDERPTLPNGWLPLGALGARALLLHEVALDVPAGLGVGERAQVQWRWAARRPRVAVGLALPAPQRLPGVFALEGAWEQQSYAHQVAPARAPSREERRRVAVHLSDWATHRLWWQAGAALDGWRALDGRGRTPPQSREYLAVEGQLEARLAGDRVALVSSGGWWVPLASRSRFGTAEMLAAWRSTTDAARPSWSAAAGLEMASHEAPFGLWPSAGAGQARGGRLRAHPLLHDGVVDGPAFGRAMAHGSVEAAYPLGRARLAGLALAGFVDVARAWRRQVGAGASPVYVDAGVGLRLQAPGTGGAVRIDVAQGLRGGGTVLSAGWNAAWPR